MYIQVNVETTFELKSLTDLAGYKKIMEHLKMKINKSCLLQNKSAD